MWGRTIEKTYKNIQKRSHYLSRQLFENGMSDTLYFKKSER